MSEAYIEANFESAANTVNMPMPTEHLTYDGPLGPFFITENLNEVSDKQLILIGKEDTDLERGVESLLQAAGILDDPDVLVIDSSSAFPSHLHLQAAALRKIQHVCQTYKEHFWPTPESGLKGITRAKNQELQEATLGVEDAPIVELAARLTTRCSEKRSQDIANVIRLLVFEEMHES